MKFVSVSPHQSVWVVRINDMSLIFLICPYLQAHAPWVSGKAPIFRLLCPFSCLCGKVVCTDGFFGWLFWTQMSCLTRHKCWSTRPTPVGRAACTKSEVPLRLKYRNAPRRHLRIAHTAPISMSVVTGWKFCIGMVINEGHPITDCLECGNKHSVSVVRYSSAVK
jgi:hypothetical protein